MSWFKLANLMLQDDYDRYLSGKSTISLDVPNICCLICLKKFQCENNLYTSRCEHKYHYQCLYDMIRSIPKENMFYSCPVCKI